MCQTPHTDRRGVFEILSTGRRLRLLTLPSLLSDLADQTFILRPILAMHQLSMSAAHVSFSEAMRGLLQLGGGPATAFCLRRFGIRWFNFLAHVLCALQNLILIAATRPAHLFLSFIPGVLGSHASCLVALQNKTGVADTIAQHRLLSGFLSIGAAPAVSALFGVSSRLPWIVAAAVAVAGEAVFAGLTAEELADLWPVGIRQHDAATPSQESVGDLFLQFVGWLAVVELQAEFSLSSLFLRHGHDYYVSGHGLRYSSGTRRGHQRNFDSHDNHIAPEDQPLSDGTLAWVRPALSWSVDLGQTIHRVHGVYDVNDLGLGFSGCIVSSHHEQHGAALCENADPLESTDPCAHVPLCAADLQNGDGRANC